jgi:hypothetical protein
MHSRQRCLGARPGDAIDLCVRVTTFYQQRIVASAAPNVEYDARIVGQQFNECSVSAVHVNPVL